MIITRSDMNARMTFKHKSSVLKYLYYVMTNKANYETVILRLFLEIVPLLAFSKQCQARENNLQRAHEINIMEYRKDLEMTTNVF